MSEVADERDLGGALSALRAGLQCHADLAVLGPELAGRFVPLLPDAELDAWFRSVGARPHGRFKTWLIGWLDPFLSSYDVHGVLGAYPMHMLGARAWGELLADGQTDSLLDVGAGAGYVTEGARAHVKHIACTETSRALRRRLQQRGFEVLDLDLSSTTLGRSFDVVSCFNVIDRTARPLSLLRSLVKLLKPAGRLLLSVPLPLQPHVHVRGGTIAPSERLPSYERSWEGAARDLSHKLLVPAGLSVQRLARVPYLSGGDAYHGCYALDAAVWVCRKADPCST
jgi:SAM-dependent methyltransferase